ncbi:glycosyltransferase family 4 protein [Leptospira kmetyi]|uniref:glycosyltransferase family 4 protein n=1 Tax=Leptospira kmetyi TaxID=408139 RepID=UPI001084053F|nr:glycosyltransferase family 1 protein [Leptospira kmetyi]TGK21408.1 glycosyltransferase family 1 protein [Leptospira kmetyi]TGK28335.1 glycosyltransferase family 1 protein [Leptospira kmetyi]TGL68297.1 glycosyltransferase family 1 protein [Leptospira kmetyi]
MVLGIDASNIRGGGGVTHLVELLNAAEPDRYDFKEVQIWGGSSTLQRINDKPWLKKNYEPLLDKSLLYRVFWTRFILGNRLKATKTDILFVPGGTYLGNFKPFVAMSQNLLPFEWMEIKRYGFSNKLFRFLILFLIQSITFKRADGTIFLTSFARDVVLKKVRLLLERTTVVYHGIHEKFFYKPRVQHDLSHFSVQKPLRILYVSFIGEYKHQWNVVRAVSSLRKDGYPVALDLIGTPDEPRPLAKLKQAMLEEDPNGDYIRYFSSIPYSTIQKKYIEADLFVFASSCETFGQIVTEAMASGLPIVCSNLSAMPEILKNAGAYFNPVDVSSLVKALQTMLNSKKDRIDSSKKAYQLAKKFSWKKAADETFEFLKRIKTESKK